MKRTLVTTHGSPDTEAAMPNWAIVPGVTTEEGVTVIAPAGVPDLAMLEDAAASHMASGADITLPDPAFVAHDSFAVVGQGWPTDALPEPSALFGTVRINRYVPSLNLVRQRPDLRETILNRQRGLVPALTESCDLACRMCPFYGCEIPENQKEYYRDYMARREGYGHADSADFLRWVDAFHPLLKVGAVSVYGPGEPFLHPDAADVLRACNQRDLSMNFATNGNRFSREQLDALKQGSVGTIIFSLDALTAETYSRVKPHGDFALIINAMEELIAAKQSGAGYSITVSFIRQEHNAHEETAFVAYWKERVDNVVVTSKYHAGRPEAEPSFTPHAVLPCPHLENGIHILANGDCWSCSAGVPDEFSLGNVDEIGPQAVIANLDRYVETRIDTGEAGPLCRDCVWWAQVQRVETWQNGTPVRVDQPYSYRTIGTKG